MCQDGQLDVEERVCRSDGEWVSVNGSSCLVKLMKMIIILSLAYDDNYCLQTQILIVDK